MASTEPPSISLCSQVEACNGSRTVGPDTQMNKEFYFVSLLTGTLATLVISLFGIVGNVINCLVFYRHGLRDRMNLCLFSLALVDFFYLLYFVPSSCISMFSHLKLFAGSDEHDMKTTIYGTGLSYALRTTSGLYIMVIALERCICVVFPLRAMSLIKTRTMAILLLILAVVPQLGFISQPLKYNVIKLEVGDGYKWALTPSQLWLSNRDVIDAIVYTVFGVSLPLATFFIVSLATFITVSRLTTAMAWRRKTSSMTKEQNYQQVALTKTLVLSSSVFILCMIPLVLLKALRLFLEEFSIYGLYSSLYIMCNITANVCSSINSSVHVLIYHSRSSRYRQELRKICLVTRRYKQEKSVSDLSVTENISRCSPKFVSVNNPSF